MVIVMLEGLHAGDIRIVKIDLRAVGVRQKIIYKQLGQVMIVGGVLPCDRSVLPIGSQWPHVNIPPLLMSGGVARHRPSLRKADISNAEG